MIEVNSRWKSVTNKEKWAARGASFVGKVKATKVVWFPPPPVETGKRAASSAMKSTRGATKQATGAAKKSTNGATKRATGAAKKSTSPSKSLTNPARRKKT
jgi:hypothetical protein